MSRDYSPDEFLDSRRISAGSARRPEPTEAPEFTRGQADPGANRERGTSNAAPEIVKDRKGRLRKPYEFRGKSYGLRTSEIHTLAEIGKFRTVSTADLREFAYGGDKARMQTDIANLVREGLVEERAIPQAETSPRCLLTLTPRGRRFLLAAGAVPQDQAIHHGFVKPREADHDADLYRLYQTAAEKIQRQGGHNLRVFLDYELKTVIYRELAKLEPNRDSAHAKTDIAQSHGLQVVRGKIPLPDLRIEYETPNREIARVDLELATEHYRSRNLAEKVRAGFSIYARPQDAVGLRRVLDQRELTAEILSL